MGMQSTIHSHEDPVRTLVLPWWNRTHSHQRHQVSSLRHDLLQAILATHRQDPNYDPFTDNRVLWAAYYLEKIENPFLRADPDLCARAAFGLRIPIEPCGKDLAAGL